MNRGVSAADEFDLVEDRAAFVSPIWAEYLQLDSAICRHFFHTGNEGRPVYLDVEPAELDWCGSLLGLEPGSFQDKLVSTTRRLLYLDDPGTPVLRRFENANRDWFKNLTAARQSPGMRVPPPPTLGLLALFVIPAEQMGSHGGQGGSHQRYYPVLTELLDIPESTQKRFVTSFGETVEDLWRGLNAWLESEDGRFGLPTAFSLSHRYVGLPVSQALIRETERRQLRRMFAQYGLGPNDAIANEEMQEILDEWISQVSSPASRQLQKLWKSPENRDQLSARAATELAAWDGYGFEQYGNAQKTISSAHKCWLYLADRPVSLFESETAFGVAIKGGDGLSESQFTFETTTEPLEIRLKNLREGLMGFDGGDYDIDTSSLLEGKISLCAEDDERSRLPRDLVPFEFDSLCNAWVESDSMELGGIYRVLVAVRFLGKALPILEAIGAKRIEPSPLTGAPEGWLVFNNFQPVVSPEMELLESQDYHLSALRSRPVKKMTLIGGLRLPGRIQRYSLDAMPSIVVVSDPASPLAVRITSQDLAVDGDKFTYRSPETVPPFSLDLEPIIPFAGDFELLLEAAGSALQAISLRLRTSSEPDPQGWQNFDDLVHRAGDALWPLRAVPADEDDGTIVAGAVSFGENNELAHVDLSFASGFAEPSAELITRQIVSAPLIPADSCVITGKHNFVFPTFDGSYSTGWMWGECKYCSSRKRAPRNHRRAEHMKMRKSETRAALTPREQNASEMKLSFQGGSLEVRVDAAADAVVYLGKGTVATLNQISRQCENSAIFAADFLRNLESLGLIEVARNRDLEAVSFEVGPTVAITTAENAIMLVGPWVEENKALARQAAEAEGAEWLEYETGGLTVSSILGMELAQLESAFGDTIDYAERAGLEILGKLPALSDIGAALERRPFLRTANTSAYDVSSARWLDISSKLEAPGAYLESTGYRRQYSYRSIEDVAHHQAAVADPYLVKHLAMQLHGRSLVQFDDINATLSVPLGCDIPGLYGRAAVLEGGVLPSVESGRLIYEGISEYFAEQLINKLGS
jgi:hypothetical protein